MPSGTFNQADLNLWEYLTAAALGLAVLYAVRRQAARRQNARGEAAGRQAAPQRLRPFRILPLPHLRRPWQGSLFVALAAILLRIALLPLLPIPRAAGHDEFSFLLQADTFAHGRLTNPTHPMWRHFETIHVLQRPTYQSMYQPMQGIILAAGQRLGDPWFGVLLATGIMCGAITWMLYAYLPPRWALLGGLLGLLHMGLFSYWMNSYWGGSHAAIGGALLLGALPRWRRRHGIARMPIPPWHHGLIGALGIAILAASRPYEGALLCVGVAIAIGIEWSRRPRTTHIAVGPAIRFLIPAGLVLALAAAGLAMYFKSVTGSPLRMPYEVNRAAYGWPMTLPWMAPAPEPSAPQSMRDYYLWEKNYHAQFHSPSMFLSELTKRLRKLWNFFLGPLLTIPLLFFGLRAFRARRLRLLVPPAIIVLAGVLIGQTAVPHYLAPITCVVLAFVVQAMRHLYVWRLRIGARVVYALPAALTLLLALHTIGMLPARPSPASWCCREEVDIGRAAVTAQLDAMPGRQLVIVRYAPTHSFFEEWIWNAADIDDAKVVWARELSAPENRELLNYFKGRTALLLEPDAHPPHLSPYPVPTPSAP